MKMIDDDEAVKTIRKLASGQRETQLLRYLICQDLSPVVSQYGISHSYLVESVDDLAERRVIYSKYAELRRPMHSIQNVQTGDIEDLPPALIAILTLKAIRTCLSEIKRSFILEDVQMPPSEFAAIYRYMVHGARALMSREEIPLFPLSNSRPGKERGAQVPIRVVVNYANGHYETTSEAARKRAISNTCLNSLRRSARTSADSIHAPGSDMANTAELLSKLHQFDILVNLCRTWAMSKDPLKMEIDDLLKGAPLRCAD